MDSVVWHPNDDLTWFKILFKTFLYKKMNQIGEPLQCLDSKNQLAQEESRAKNLNPRFFTISNLGYWEIKCLKSINHTTVNRTNQKVRLLHPSKISGHILQNGDAIHLGISCFFRIISTNLMEINEPLIRSDFMKCREPRKNRKWCRSYESVIFPNNLEKNIYSFLQN